MKLAKTLVIAFALMLIASSATFASVTFITTSTLNLVAPNARTGLAGDVTFSGLTAGGTVGGATPDTLTITYGGAQISELSTPVVTVTIGGVATVFTGFTAYGAAKFNGATLATSSITCTINPTNITMTFTAFATTTFNVGDTININQVRLNVVPVTAGSTVGATLTATVSSVASQITVSNPQLPVANFVNPIVIKGSTVFPPPATFSTGSVALTNVPATGMSEAEILISEAGAFSNAFETEGASQPTQLILTVTGIPAGLTLRNNNTTAPISPAIGAAKTSASVTPVVNYLASGQVGSTATVVIQITAQDPTLIETIAVDLVFQTAGGTLPIGTGNITATLGPEASLLGIIPGGTGIPFGPAAVTGGPVSYFNNPQPSFAFVTVVQLTTELLSTFNVYIPGATGFNTGFSVANTTGFLGITAQTDVITVTLQPADGSAATVFTTSAANRPGSGLNASGQLPAGASWTVLLSDILKTAGISGSFEGYVRFTCAFTNAHGVNYIADINFAVQAQGYEMLVIPASSTVPRVIVFESLGH